MYARPAEKKSLYQVVVIYSTCFLGPYKLQDAVILEDDKEPRLHVPVGFYAATCVSVP